jgi:translation initiation factor 5B
MAHNHEQKIRQPIVTVAGHVDHGKTSLLDRIRGTTVAAGEAGGITQKISFTLVPREKIIERCPAFSGEEGGKRLEIPGFLFIDTPGHAAFTNLRKRGGSLADLAILVVDINEGIKPQTAEVIQLYKTNKTPFIIVLNKVDAIGGWRKQSESMKENVEKQAQHVKINFEEKLYTFIASLSSHGFESELYYNLTDFTKKIALVPASAKTGEGITEILMMLCGLSQKFLREGLKLGAKPKGIVLEIKKEKTLQYAELILYDGMLRAEDEIAIANFSGGEPIISRIRTMEEIQPLSYKYKPVKEAIGATGLRIQLTERAEILPGMPFAIYENNLEELTQEFKKEITELIRTDAQGIIVKAESLGSLEAVLTLLRQANIQILKAGIGNINKTDIISAKANLESDSPENAVILGFNSYPDNDAKEMMPESVKVISGEVVYRLIDELSKWQQERRDQILKDKLMELAPIAKVEILHKYVFRNSNPAIFGVKVLGGKIRPNMKLIDDKGAEVGRIKGIQEGKESIQQATEGMEVAISVAGQNYERHIAQLKNLYTEMGQRAYRELKENKNILTDSEKRVLMEIGEIKKF